MARLLFTILAALSLVGALVATGLTVRSYWADEKLGWETRDFPTPAILDRRIYVTHLSAGGLKISYTSEYLPRLSPREYAAFRDVYPVRTGYYCYHEKVGYPHATTFTDTLPNYWGFSFHAPRFDTVGIPGTTDRLLGWYVLIFPAWLLVPLLALLPTRWVFLHRGRWRRERLERLHCCAACGYDLHMRAAGQKCPECGTPIVYMNPS